MESRRLEDYVDDVKEVQGVKDEITCALDKKIKGFEEHLTRQGTWPLWNDGFFMWTIAYSFKIAGEDSTGWLMLRYYPNPEKYHQLNPDYERYREWESNPEIDVSKPIFLMPLGSEIRVGDSYQQMIRISNSYQEILDLMMQEIDSIPESRKQAQE